MIDSPLPLLFLDVDGPLIPFGATRQQFPDGYPTYRAARPVPRGGGANPLLTRANPAYGPRLAALPCELVWATTWMSDANACVAPWLGLPEAPVVAWPDPSEDEGRDGLHWKTRTLLRWAAGGPFAWVDDEITDRDRAWVEERCPGRALLYSVDPRRGLADDDFPALEAWLRAAASAGRTGS
ncbi:HAD domain-containing protein [Streptomyces sp. NPDC050617]|uniref:HAD domain-containing protein n=1 Tax=Streptomyces sp. NPDC050617 TaxID=3154628 RepID=UPI00343CEC9F